jgi:OFA family oxalate/formate antiporter-like MFS transporter
VTETKARGFYGWWLIFFLWVVYTIPIGFAFYSPVVLYPFMIEGMGWSRGEIMFGSTAIVLLFGLTGPLAAWMIGRFGARFTLVTGGIILAIATLLMGLIGHVYPVYLVLSLFVGLGAALASMIPVQTVIVSWFNVRRALAMGLVMGGGAIGGFLAPQIISVAVQAAGGNWRIGWFIIAVASVIGIVVAILAVRNQPSDVGQHPDGLAPREAEAAASGSSRAARTYRTPVDWTLRDALKTPAMWLLVVALACSFFLWQVIATQGPLHLQDRGFDPAMAAFFYSLAIGLSIAGRFTIAAVGDIIEPRFLLAFGAFCILLGGILFWFVSPGAMWTAYLYPLLAGFGFGVAYVCVPTITGNYWGPTAFAGISGLEWPIVLSFQAIAAPLAGFIYDLQGSYFTIMVISWILAAIGFVATLLCTPPKPKTELGMKGSSV